MTSSTDQPGLPGNSDPDAFFTGHPHALAVYRRVRSMIEAIGPVEVRTTSSHVSFRRRRGFAYLWLPGRWLSRPGAEVVLSMALGRASESPRFKEVVHPAPDIWMHHLEVRSLTDLDEEVAGWLREAFKHSV